MFTFAWSTFMLLVQQRKIKCLVLEQPLEEKAFDWFPLVTHHNHAPKLSNINSTISLDT